MNLQDSQIDKELKEDLLKIKCIKIITYADIDFG